MGVKVTVVDLAFESMSSASTSQNIDDDKSESLFNDDFRSYEQQHILDALVERSCSRRLT